MAAGERRMAAQRTSTAGVNQRSSQSASPLASGTMKAVSAEIVLRRRSPAASSSGSQASSGITAAGLPANGRSAKASTWTEAQRGHSLRLRSRVSSVSASGLPGSSTWPSGSIWISSSQSGKFAAQVAPRLARPRHAPSPTVIAGSTQTWNCAKSLRAAGAGAQVVNALAARDGARRRRRSAAASPRAIPCPSAGRSRVRRGAPGAPDQPQRRWRCRTADRRRRSRAYWSSASAAITARLSSRSDW